MRAFKQETFGPISQPINVENEDGASESKEDGQEEPNNGERPSAEEHTPERVEDPRLLSAPGRADNLGEQSSGNVKGLSTRQAQRLLESVQSNTDQQLAKMKQTIVGTYESKKEILMQSARTEKELTPHGGHAADH